VAYRRVPHRRQPWGWGLYPLNFRWRDGYVTNTDAWLTGQPSGPQHNQIAPAYSEPIGLVTVDSTSFSFTSISKISTCISLGVRPLDTILGLCPWTPLGDFRPPGYFPLCVHPSKLSSSRWRHWCSSVFKQYTRVSWLVNRHAVQCSGTQHRLVSQHYTSMSKSLVVTWYRLSI